MIISNDNSLRLAAQNPTDFGDLLSSISLSGKVWSRFEAGDIVSDVKQKVTEALWSTATGSLKTFFISTVQSASSAGYYYDVYHADPATDSTALVQFAMTLVIVQMYLD